MSFLAIAGLIYLALMGYAYFSADGMIFLPPHPSYDDGTPFIKIPTAGGTAVAALHLPCPGADYTILFSHGNGEDLGSVREELPRYCEEGFSVIAYDYSGYGRSTGRPSEAAAYLDIDAVCDYLIREIRVPPERIILQGRSVGSGPSIDLAARRTVGGLILESPFVSAFRVLTHVPIFPIDKFENIKKIGSVSCPVLVIHGKRDSIVPFWHGETLYRKAQGPKMNYWVEGADHNDLKFVAGEEYWKVLDRFRRLIAGQGEANR